MQVIEATTPGTDQIPYLYDTNALTLEVGQGCRGVSRQLHQVGDLFATSIVLSRVLDVGETSTLEYWTTYRYEGEPADPALRHYRAQLLDVERQHVSDLICRRERRVDEPVSAQVGDRPVDRPRS